MEFVGGEEDDDTSPPDDLGLDEDEYLATWAEGEAGEAVAVPMDVEGGALVWAEGEAQRISLIQPFLQKWQRKEPRADLENHNLCESLAPLACFCCVSLTSRSCRCFS